MIPPCVKDVRGDGVPSTVVVKMSATSTVIQWASGSTLPGIEARATALVYLKEDIELETGIVYLVLTPLTISTLQNYQKHLTKKLTALSAEIKWIRPLDRRLQRLFQWGDAWMDKEQLQTAIDDGDKDTLIQCFPALTNAIELGHTEHLPQLLSDSKPLLCLTDRTPQDRRQSLYIDHELNDTHVFGERGKNWECTLCNEMPAARCVCGAQRCGRHTKPPESRHKAAWKQVDGAPFFVHDPKWMTKEHKVEWIRDELGGDASLEEFARVYCRLFADKGCAEKRRTTCLGLYCVFNPTFKAKKECKLSPIQLQAFQRVFDPAALSRCRWCSKQIPLELGKIYCNLTCAEAANPPQQCRTCTSEDHILVHAPRLGPVNSSVCRFAALVGMSKCKGCGLIEYCEVLGGYERSKRRTTTAAPPRWTQRKRS